VTNDEMHGRAGHVQEMGNWNEKIQFDGRTIRLLFTGTSGKTDFSPVEFTTAEADRVEYVGATFTKSGYIRLLLVGAEPEDFHPSLSEFALEILSPISRRSREKWDGFAEELTTAVTADTEKHVAPRVSYQLAARRRDAANIGLFAVAYARYVAGLPESTEDVYGSLVACTGGIGMGNIQEPIKFSRPDRYVVAWDEIKTVTIDGGQ
jgi:hypothetical protein